MVNLILFFSLLALTIGADVICRDPDLGGQLPKELHGKHKYLLITGGGAGIGNFLIFYPSAYYFAMLTGRDILIMDDSLIGEMCKLLRCGFPLLSEISAAYPHLRNEVILGAKTANFGEHLRGDVDYVETLVRADGSKLMSGWYSGFENATKCITRVTGCQDEDIFCHDRHALKRLVRGPFFATALAEDEERRVIGVPANLKHAMITLPHSYSPRLDAAIHIRTQFDGFEQSVGSDDGQMWVKAEKEVQAWLDCSSSECGKKLFAIMTGTLVDSLAVAHIVFTSFH